MVKRTQGAKGPKVTSIKPEKLKQREHKNTSLNRVSPTLIWHGAAGGGCYHTWHGLGPWPGSTASAYSFRRLWHL